MSRAEISRLHLFFLAAVCGIFAWSLIHPKDLFTWVLEVFPVLIAAPIVLLTYKRFRLTTLAYILISIHACILIIGGHYTYAEMPLFNWIRDAFGLARNHYDRLGHFAQGFVPVVLARELLIRKSVIKRGGWLTFILLCIAMAISASYELIEWAAAELTGTAATAFLGTQGDVWDTQWDMFMCLIGATVSIITMTRLHDRQMNKL